MLDRDRPGLALRRVAPQLVMVALWAALHPFLRERLAGHLAQPGADAGRISPVSIALRTLLSVVNLDQWPEPGWLGALVPALPGIALLAVGLAWALRHVQPVARAPHSPARASGAPGLFALGWAALAALPLFMPTVGWLSYYTLLSALGAWAAFARLPCMVSRLDRDRGLLPALRSAWGGRAAGPRLLLPLRRQRLRLGRGGQGPGRTSAGSVA